MTAAPIASLISAARLRTRVARAFEAACLGAAAGLVTAASVELSGAGFADLDALIASTLAGALCAATWWNEHRAGALDVARKADAALAQQGALVSAFETEGSGGLASALATRVLLRLPGRAASRAAHRPIAAFLGAPVAGVALLLASIEATPRPRIAELVDAASRSLAAASRTAGEADPRSERLAELSETAARLARELERDPLAAREALERLRGDLEALRRAGEAESSDPGAAEIERASELASAALGGAPAASDAARAGSGGSSRSTAGSAAPAAPSQNGGADSTMSGSARPDQAPATASAPTPPPDPSPEPGTLGPRWWPEAYDGVVAEWLAARDRPRSP